MRLRIEKFGDKAEGITLRCDPRRPEPDHTRIQFPGGHVEVTRATDDPDCDLWVHVYVNHGESVAFEPEEKTARIVDARLDQTDKHAADADVGDFNRPQLYHLAVRIEREGK
jgi:hypothetical protein